MSLELDEPRMRIELNKTTMAAELGQRMGTVEQVEGTETDGIRH